MIKKFLKHKNNHIKIQFIDTLGVDSSFIPVPSDKLIPEWYKKTNSYINNEKKPKNGETSATIKRCMPVFDAMTGGYLIKTYSDVYISPIKDEDEDKIKAFEVQSSAFSPISSHAFEQAEYHPLGHKDMSYLKWINPWGIKTPKGYSTLFLQPLHRESIFTIAPGIVDTDKYHMPVNFPFVFNDMSFEGLIPAGTPIAQVFPFKRDNWEMEIVDDAVIVKNINEENIKKLRSKFFDSYKTQYRSNKEYL